MLLEELLDNGGWVHYLHSRSDELADCYDIRLVPLLLLLPPYFPRQRRSISSVGRRERHGDRNSSPYGGHLTLVLV